MAVVLVAEDEPVVREFARDVLHEAGHEAIEAAAVDEALAIIASDQPVDVLFTDINLRPLLHGGLELARRAIELRPMILVIYTTGMQLDQEIQGQFVDAAPFIPKPYLPNTLLRAISDVLLGAR